jgi:hypothetical protein
VSGGHEAVIALVWTGRPLSYGSRGRAKYQERLRSAYIEKFGKDYPKGQTLYGVVYYLKKTLNTLDADNLSKPVWDALSGAAYGDDSEIRLRHAGIVDMRNFNIDEFDLTHVPDDVSDHLIDAVGREPHVIYIELGPLAIDMFRFGFS